jgi:hypothetical protein
MGGTCPCNGSIDCSVIGESGISYGSANHSFWVRLYSGKGDVLNISI